MQYFYHGTDPIRLVKIRKNGLCHGLHTDERKFHYQDGIFVSPRFGRAVRFATAGHNKDFGLRGYQRERRHEKEPGVVIRFERSEIENKCDIYKDPLIENAMILRCQDRCIKPKAEICFIPETEIIAAFRPRLLLDFASDNPDDAADKLPCKWKPLRWIQ